MPAGKDAELALPVAMYNNSISPWHNNTISPWHKRKQIATQTEAPVLLLCTHLNPAQSNVPYETRVRLFSIGALTPASLAWYCKVNRSAKTSEGDQDAPV